jgi:eukaryotic-like serine/threonine-protein kinase
MKDTLPLRLRFGVFELDLKSGELRKSGQRIVLPEQSLQILRILVAHAGKIATHEEIQKQLWPDETAVEFDHGLNAAIKALRAALGDSSENPQYVETVGRRGYRLLATVERVDSTSGDGASALNLDPASLTGQTFSQYRVMGIVGSGGMGVVYEAEDLKLGRRVALKFLPQELGHDARALDRFDREARAASALEHPNICPIYQFGEHEGQPFIVMQLLHGQTLKDCLAVRNQASAGSQAKALPLDQVLDISIQVADGLEAAHEKGIIHRDVKPANIFLTDKGGVKILDFGLAKLLQSGSQKEVDQAAQSATATQVDDRSRWRIRGSEPEVPSAPSAEELSLSGPGAAVGTLAYMSPEQVRKEKLDARSDLFSFGLVLYEMATGQRAFTGPNAEVLQQGILNDAAAPARGLNPELPSKLEKIIHKAMEKDRDLRYQHASEIRADLNRIKLGIQSRERAAGLRRKLLVAMAVVLIAAIAGGLYWGTRTTNALTDKDTVVLADITNSTGEAVFDDALNTALTVELQQSPFLNMLASDKVSRTLKMMNQPPDARLTPALASEVCQRTNSKAVVAGSISDAGNHYRIELNAVDCKTGKSLARTEREAASRNEVVRTLGVAGGDLRSRMGEPRASLQEFNKPLDEATSSSLEALQALTMAANVKRQHGDAATGVAYLKRAVELDPNYAQAYVRLGIPYLNTGETSLTAQYFSKAYELRDRVTQRDRFGIVSFYYIGVTGELEKGIQTFSEATKVYPKDPSWYMDLSAELLAIGQYEKSAAQAQESIRLDPAATPYVNLMTSYVSLNRFDEAKATFEEARVHKLDDANLLMQRYVLAFLQGDGNAMREVVAWAAGKPGVEDLFVCAESRTQAFNGRMGKAGQLAQNAVEMATHARAPQSAADCRIGEALQEAEIGNPGRAQQRVTEALALSTAMGTRTSSALALARAGDVAQAEKLAHELDQAFPQGTMMQNYFLPTIRASIELQRNNPAKAIKILEAAVPYELGGFGAFASLYPAYVRGEAYLKAGQGQQAAAEFQKVIDHPGIVNNFITGVLAHLQLARAEAMAGGREAARKSYQDFFALWKDADPDIPVLHAAKEEYAKLK